MDTSKTALFNRLVDAWTKVDPASSPYTTLHTREFKLFCEAMGLSVKYTEGVGIELTDVSKLISAEDMAKCGHIAFTGFGVTGAAVQLSNPTPYDMFNDGRSVAYREGLKLGHLENKERIEQLEQELEKIKYKYEFEMTAGAQCELVLKQQLTDLEQALSRCADDNEDLTQDNKELKEEIRLQRALIEDLRIEADGEKRAHDAAIGSPCGGDTNDVAEYWHDKWKEAEEKLEDRYGSVAQANHDMYSEQVVPLALELERVRKELETNKLELAQETAEADKYTELSVSEILSRKVAEHDLKTALEREAKLVEELEATKLELERTSKVYWMNRMWISEAKEHEAKFVEALEFYASIPKDSGMIEGVINGGEYIPAGTLAREVLEAYNKVKGEEQFKTMRDELAFSQRIYEPTELVESASQGEES